jgi:uncharacterized delta-60 repeat protein
MRFAAHARSTALLACCLPGFAGPAYATAGTLDPSFLGRGWSVLSDTVGGQEFRDQTFYDATVDDAGRVVALGGFRDPLANNTDCRVLVSSPDGRNIEHFRRIAFDRGGENVDFCAAVEPQSDGRLLVSGYATTAGNRFTGIVARLAPDASLDDSFFDSGVFDVNARIPWIDPADNTVLVNAARDAQGRTLVVGRVVDSSGLSRGLVLRFNVDGSLDTGFGTDGAVALADFNPPRVNTSQIHVMPAGLIYVAGSTDNPGLPRQTVIFRLLDSGAFDTTYGAGMNGVSGNGGGGRGFTGRCDRIGGLVVDAEDQVYLGCEPDASGVTPGPIRAPGVLRLTSAGQPDPGYGSQGLVELLPTTSAVGFIQTAPRIALDTGTGRVTVAATLSVSDQPGNPSDAHVTRILPNGAIDFGFGYRDGVARLRLDDPLGPTSESTEERLTQVALDARGRALVVGSRTSGSSTRFLVARLGMADPNLASGFLDPDFQSTGYDIDAYPEVVGPGLRLEANARAVSVNAAGKITNVGRVRFDTSPVTARCTVSRKLPGGSRDTSFDGDGRRTLNVDPAARDSSLCTAVLSLDDDSTLIAGTSVDSGTLIRLLPNGQVDTGFFGNGVLETWTDLNFQALGRRAAFGGIHRDASGRILLAGTLTETNAGIVENFGLLIRLLPDLSIDASFGEQGIVRLTTSTNPRRLFGGGARTDSVGRIYYVASEGTSTDGNLGPAVYRLLDDGSGDGSYPGGGYLRLRNSCNQGGGFVDAIAVDAQDALLIDCYRSGTPNVSMGILRLLDNGQADINYGDGGFNPIRFAPSFDTSGRASSINRLLPLSDGKLIVVGGHANTSASVLDRYGQFNVGVLRLFANGTADGSFGDVNAGASLFRLPTVYGLFNLSAQGAALQPDGRVVVVGTFFDARPGQVDANRASQLILRVGNVLPLPVGDDVFRDGFESPE